MDIIGPIAFIIICLIILSICGWCCKKRRPGFVYGQPNGTNVTVTTQPVHQSPLVNPPYPVHQGPTPYNYPPQTMMPMPQPPPGVYPPPGGPPYPPNAGAPYPPGPVPGMGAPYPPQVGGAYPPPYDVAMAQPPIQPPPSREAYGKQAPYNPNY
ncbi:uncharacterized protein LOC132708061 isoform X2 [Cylas formicarius]|uniref:uncharacterized protein LOC132708061 isoform X2 n=1 Tax=Cylas formicarius TaxID=197179 RepID=UPI002958CCC9|nr:uncharacterized protein LOC132708061 isoform X2 [Cylas formicarius]XP_060536149.1 uncharacterized protein LOC132708061 isoform X2 [Cylas formicarius]XP_060536150.1 uncharacterized protein LOC132708061 isoform X2 [Cylas formicarius]